MKIKSDIDILEESYNKYRDKNGRKARNLKLRIESFKALQSICKQIIKNHCDEQFI